MWSKWRDLTDTNLNANWSQSPGIYFIRLVNQRGTPAKIPRIIGLEKNGILYIGMASDLPPKEWTQRRVGVSIKAGS